MKKARESKGRTWVGAISTCCNAYTRLYLNTLNGAYVGNCPRCKRSVTLEKWQIPKGNS